MNLMASRISIVHTKQRGRSFHRKSNCAVRLRTEISIGIHKRIGEETKNRILKYMKEHEAEESGIVPTRMLGVALPADSNINSNHVPGLPSERTKAKAFP